MIRNLKMLGLMAVAALAMSAMLASAAQAETDGVFTAGETEENHEAVLLHGDQYGGTEDNFFQAAAGEDTVVCDDATFTGTDADGTAKELTIEAEYIHCETGTGGEPATVDMNGCDYTFHQPTNTEGDYAGEASLTCPEGNAVVISVFGFGGPTSHSFQGCTIEVFPNEKTAEDHDTDRLGGEVHYINGTDAATGEHDVTVNATVSGISSRQSGFGCENGEHIEEGTYRNTVTVTGTEDKKNGKAIGVWVSDEEDEEEEE